MSASLPLNQCRISALRIVDALIHRTDCTTRRPGIQYRSERDGPREQRYNNRRTTRTPRFSNNIIIFVVRQLSRARARHINITDARPCVAATKRIETFL